MPQTNLSSTSKHQQIKHFMKVYSMGSMHKRGFWCILKKPILKQSLVHNNTHGDSMETKQTFSIHFWIPKLVECVGRKLNSKNAQMWTRRNCSSSQITVQRPHPLKRLSTACLHQTRKLLHWPHQIGYSYGPQRSSNPQTAFSQSAKRTPFVCLLIHPGFCTGRFSPMARIPSPPAHLRMCFCQHLVHQPSAVCVAWYHPPLRLSQLASPHSLGASVPHIASPEQLLTQNQPCLSFMRSTLALMTSCTWLGVSCAQSWPLKRARLYYVYLQWLKQQLILYIDGRVYPIHFWIGISFDYVEAAMYSGDSQSWWGEYWPAVKTLLAAQENCRIHPDILTWS